jgi:general secretion pathway protein G
MPQEQKRVMIRAFTRRHEVGNGPACPSRQGRSVGEAGYTLLELLVVLGILVLIVTLTAPQVLQYLGQARSQAAQVQIRHISTALELFYLHNGGYPSEAVGLSALMKAPPGTPNWRGPYLKNAEGLMDPWGRPYRYRVPGRHGEFDIYTLGRDNREGGTGEDRDVTSW